MDAEKLFRILKDLQEDDQKLGINGKLDTIRNSVAQNNPEGFANAQKQLADFLKEIETSSLIYVYSHTETLLLEKIGGTSYFGKGLVARLETVFASRSFELVTKLDEFRTQRNDFVKKVQRLATGFADIGIVEYRPDAFEVGVVLPETEADLDRLAKRVRDLKLLLSALAEASGVEEKTIKITRMSNGSLELFSLQPLEIAELLSSLLTNVSTIWDKIAKFRKKAEDTDKDELLSPEAKKEIKKTLEKETEKIKKEILEEMPDQFLKKLGKKIEEGRRNEIRNQIRISVHAIFGWFEAGIEVDITPVRVPTDENTPKRHTEAVAVIERTNSRLRAIYELPPEIKKLPFTLPSPEDIKQTESPTPKQKPEGETPPQPELQ